MGVSGMTGFGRAEGSAPNLHWIWEARSVNGRGLDVKVRLPNGYDALEPIVRDAAKTRFRRGSLQIGLSVRSDAAETGLHINTAFIQAAVAAGAIYVREGLVAPPRWTGSWRCGALWWPSRPSRFPTRRGLLRFAAGWTRRSMLSPPPAPMRANRLPAL